MHRVDWLSILFTSLLVLFLLLDVRLTPFEVFELAEFVSLTGIVLGASRLLLSLCLVL